MTEPEIKIDRVKLEIRGSKKLSLDELKSLSRKIKLDKGDKGFVKVMYKYYGKIAGLEEEIEAPKRYERPPREIPSGAACNYCDPDKGPRIGPNTHEETCDNPQIPYLLATAGFFKKELVDPIPGVEGPNTTLDERIKTTPKLKGLRDRWIAGKLTEEDIEETLNNAVTQADGVVTVTKPRKPILVTYREVKPLSGVDNKTQEPSDWKNAVCVYYVSETGTRTQFRIDGEGKIMVLECEYGVYQDGSAVRDITQRISKVVKDWKPMKKPVVVDMTIRSFKMAEGVIDIEKLRRDLFPLSEAKKYVSAEHIKVFQKTETSPFRMEFQGPELDFLGDESINVPITQRPISKTEGRMMIKMERENVKYSLQLYKKGTSQFNISHTTKNKENKLTLNKIKPVIITLYMIIQSLLIEKNTTTQTRTRSKSSTVSGNPLPTRKETSSSVCRGAKPNIPSPQPAPYSFRGKCPSPGQVIFPLEGVEGKDGKYYPCCGKLTRTGKKSESAYRNHLIEGFPTEAAAREAGVPTRPDKEDRKSGVLPRDFDKKGTELKVKLPGNSEQGYVNVKMVGMERNGKFTVSTSGGGTALINRSNIMPESRYRLGLRKLLEQRQNQLIKDFGKRKGTLLYREYLCSVISGVGRVCSGGESTLMTQEEATIATEGLGSVPFFYLTYIEVQRLVNHKYGVVAFPIASQIVAITKGKKSGTVTLIDLQSGETKEVENWKNFKGTLVGNLHKSGATMKFVIWKIGQADSSPGTAPSNWRIENALERGGIVEENIVAFCNKNAKKLDETTLVFVPIPRDGFTPSGSRGSANTPLVWSPRGQTGKPILTLQLLEQIDENKQSAEWIVGTEDGTFPRQVLGKRPKLTIRIKKKQIANLGILKRETADRYVSVVPQFNRSGLLDSGSPFVIRGVATKAMPRRTLENAINMLLRRPSTKALTPVKYKGGYAWNIDAKYYIYDEESDRLALAV